MSTVRQWSSWTSVEELLDRIQDRCDVTLVENPSDR